MFRIVIESEGIEYVQGVESLRRNAIRSVFCYAYRPGHNRDGGFSVNVFTNDMLSFSVFDRFRRLQHELAFQLQPGTCQTILDYIQGADDWLWNFPPRMCYQQIPDEISIIGVDGYSLFQIEDFPRLVVSEFRSIRGHNTRLMMNLIEDIASLLSRQGLDLTLNSFHWSPSVQPLVPAAGEGDGAERKTV